MPQKTSADNSAPDRAPGDLWLWLTLGLGAASAASFLIRVWTKGEVIQADALMFLSWTSRWRDPDLLRGDLLADYWHSVTPWFYKAVFWTADRIGIEPLVFVKILPALLCLAVALFSFRFLRAIGAGPIAAFVTTALLLVYFADADTLANGTPRSFWAPLVLAALDGLARKKVLQTALAQLLLAGCYPQMTFVMASVIGATLIAPRKPYFLDLSPQRLILVAVCAFATIAGILPFLLEAGRFAPVVTLNEALQIPAFGPVGRNRIMAADGTLDFLCSGRLSMFLSKCRGVYDFTLLLGLIAAGTVILAARTLRPAPGRTASALPLLVFLASLFWFALAIMVLFRLHLPSRYTVTLLPLGILTLGPLLVESAARLADRHNLRSVAAVIVMVLVAFVAVGALRHKSDLRTPPDQEVLAAIRALPRDAVIAGLVGDLDFSPALTERSTLFSRELTIGYHLGYLRPVMARMEDMRDVILTHDPAILADRLEKNRITMLLVYPATLTAPSVPRPFRGFFGSDLAGLEEASAREGETPLARLAGGCTVKTFKTVLALDAKCLAGAAKLIR